MTAPLFFVQTAPTSNGWALALRSNQRDVLTANDEVLLNAGFRKTTKGHYVITAREEGGVLSLPNEVRALLSETHFASMQEPTPWVLADDLGISYVANSRNGGRPTTVIAKAGVAAHQALLYAGFKKTEKGVMYLAHPDNRAFESHEEMVRHLFQVSRMAASYMGMDTKTVALTVIPNKEVLGLAQSVSRNTVFEMPSLAAALLPDPEPEKAPKGEPKASVASAPVSGAMPIEETQAPDQSVSPPSAPLDPVITAVETVVDTKGVTDLVDRVAYAVGSQSDNFIALCHSDTAQPLSVIVQDGVLRRVDVLSELDSGFAISTRIDLSESGQVEKADVINSSTFLGQQAEDQFTFFSDLTRRSEALGDWYLVNNDAPHALDMNIDDFTLALDEKLSDLTLVELAGQESAVAGKVSLDSVLASDAVELSENAIGELVYRRGDERFVLNSSGEEILFSGGTENNSQNENPRFLVLDPEAAGPTALATVMSYASPMFYELERGHVTADIIADELQAVTGSKACFSQAFWNTLNMASLILNSADARKPLEALQLISPPLMYNNEAESKAAIEDFVNRVAASSHTVISEMVTAATTPELTRSEKADVIKSEVGTHAGKVHVDDVIADAVNKTDSDTSAEIRQQPSGLVSIDKIKDALEQDIREARASHRRTGHSKPPQALDALLKTIISGDALEGGLLYGYPTAFAQVERLELLNEYPIDKNVAAEYLAELSNLKAENRNDNLNTSAKVYQDLPNIAKHTYDMKDSGLLVEAELNGINSEEAENESVVRHDDGTLEGTPANDGGSPAGRGPTDGKSAAPESAGSGGQDNPGNGSDEKGKSDERVGGLGSDVEQIHVSGSRAGRDEGAEERAGRGLTLFSMASEALGVESGDAKPLLELLQSIDENGAKPIGNIRFGRKGKAHKLFHIQSTNTIFPGYQSDNNIHVALGLNNEGEIVRVDAARVRSRERAPSIFAAEKVLVVPTRGGIRAEVQSLEDEFKIAAPYAESALVMVHLSKDPAFQAAHSNAAKIATAVEELNIDITLMDSGENIAGMEDLLKATSSKAFINEFNEIAEEKLLELSPSMTPLAEYAFSHSPSVNNNYPYGHLIDSNFGSTVPEDTREAKEPVVDLSDLPELPLRISKGFLPRDANDQVIFELANQIDGALTQYLAGENPVGMLVATKNHDGTTITATNFLTKKTMFTRNGMSLEDAVKSSSGNASANMRILNVDNAHVREDISRVCIDILGESALADWQETVREVPESIWNDTNNAIYPSSGSTERFESLISSGESIGSVPFMTAINEDDPYQLSYSHTVMVHPAGTYEKTLKKHSEFISVAQASLVTVESRYGRLLGFNPDGHALYQGENGLRTINNRGIIEVEPHVRAYSSVNTSVLVKLSHAENTFELHSPLKKEHMKFNETFFTTEMDESKLAAYGEALSAQNELKALVKPDFELDTLLDPGITRTVSLKREKELVDEAFNRIAFARQPEAHLDVKISNMRIVQISDKAIMVTGDTKPHKDVLGKEGLKGLFKQNLKGHTGWMFPLKRLEEVEGKLLERVASTIQERSAVLGSDTKLQKLIGDLEAEQAKLNVKLDFKMDLGIAGVDALAGIENDLQECSSKIDDVTAGKMINALNSGVLTNIEPSIIRFYGIYPDVRPALHAFIKESPLSMLPPEDLPKIDDQSTAMDEALKFESLKDTVIPNNQERIVSLVGDVKLGEELYDISANEVNAWITNTKIAAEQSNLQGQDNDPSPEGEKTDYLQVTGKYENYDTIGLTIPDALIRQLNTVLSHSKITREQVAAEGSMQVFFKDKALKKAYSVEVDNKGYIGFISNSVRNKADEWVERKKFDFIDNIYLDSDSPVSTSITRNTIEHPHNFKFHIRSLVHSIESGALNVSHSFSDVTREYNGLELGAVVPGNEPLITDNPEPVTSSESKEPAAATNPQGEPEIEQSIPEHDAPEEPETKGAGEPEPLILIQNCENQQRANIKLPKGVIEHVNNVLRDEGISQTMARQEGGFHVIFEDVDYKLSGGSGFRPVEFGITPDGGLSYITEYSYAGDHRIGKSLEFDFDNNSFHQYEWGMSSSLASLKTTDAEFLRVYFSNFNSYAKMGSYHARHSQSDHPREYNGRKLGPHYHPPAENDLQAEDQPPVSVALDVLDANSDPRLNDWLTNREITSDKMAQALVEARVGNNVRLENGTVAVMRTLPGRNSVSISSEYDSVKFEAVSYKQLFGEEKASEIEEHLMPLMAAQANYSEREPLLLRHLPIFDDPAARYAGELINTHFSDLSVIMSKALQSHPLDDLKQSIAARNFSGLVTDMKEYASIARDHSSLPIEFLHSAANRDNVRIDDLLKTQASLVINHSLLELKDSFFNIPSSSDVDLNHIGRPAASLLVQSYLTAQVAAYAGKEVTFDGEIGLVPDSRGGYDTILKTENNILQIAASGSGSKNLTESEFKAIYDSGDTIQIGIEPSALTKKGFLLSSDALTDTLTHEGLREAGGDSQNLRESLIQARLDSKIGKKSSSGRTVGTPTKPLEELERDGLNIDDYAAFAYQEVVEKGTTWNDFAESRADLVDTLITSRIGEAYDAFLSAGAVRYKVGEPWPLYLNESIIDLQAKNNGRNNQRFGFSVSCSHLPTTTFVDDIRLAPQELAQMIVSATVDPELSRGTEPDPETKRSSSATKPASNTEAISDKGNAVDGLHPEPNPRSNPSTPTTGVASKALPKVDTIEEAFVLDHSQGLGTGGSVTKFNRNIEAIALLKELERIAGDKTGSSKNISPTLKEKEVLSLYVGWGGIPEAFRKPSGGFVNGWEKRALALEDILTEKELESAARSTLNAHFTSLEVVDAMYAGLQRIGVKGPFKMIEPAAGTGNFIGGMPKELRDNAVVTAVELDSLTGRMASGTYTDKNTKVLPGMGFQELNQAGGSYDVAIGNPPYGNYRVFDPNFPQLSGTIHNFFGLKSLELLRPGGIKAFVTSRYVMDTVDPKIRKSMADQADLLSAIRLPDNAFKANAGTEVVTDILFFQRRSEPLALDEQGATVYPNWVGSTPIPVAKKDSDEQLPFNVNDYFIENPGNVLGVPVIETGMYREGLTYKAIDDGRSFSEQLSEVIQTLPEGVYAPEETVLAYARDHLKGVLVGEENIDRDVTGVSVGTMFTYENKVWERINDADMEFSAKEVSYRLGSKGQEIGLSDKDRSRLYGMVSIREAGDKLIKLERETNGVVPEVEKARRDLGQQYDRFVKRFGFLNRPSNVRFVRQDSAYVRIVALEKDYVPAIAANNSGGKPPRKESAQKSDIFHERVASFKQEVNLTAENPEDALAISLKERGQPDVPFMCELLDMPKEEILESLKESLFLDPETDSYTWAPIYLSGNVRKKLKQAELAAASEDAFDVNVTALKANQPKTIPIEDVGIQFGAHWIPRHIIIDFIRDRAKDSKLDVNAHYNKGTGEWKIKTGVNVTLNQEWSTGRASSSKVIQAAANSAPIKIFDEVDGEAGKSSKRVLNEQATTEANQVVDRLKKTFGLWAIESTDRASILETEYNEKVNCTVRADISAPAGYYPKGVIDRSIFNFREHQINYIFRSLMQSNIGAIHCVGAGKTSAEIAATMEQVRVGQCSKPIICVPNHLTGHWAAEIQRLCPSASILVPDGKKDFLKANRQKLFARIATGNWDFVVIAHSQLIKLPTDRELEREFIKEEIENITASLSEAQSEAIGPRDMTVKRLEKQKLDVEARLEESIAKSDVDTGVTFGQLGIDKISIDEFHKFKNLAYSTKLNVAGLGNPTGSQKAFDAFVKVSSVTRHGGKISALTATPISNSIAEMYTYLRYMAPDALKDRDIHSFDAWARVFAEVTTELELKITGDGYRLNSRLSKFHNLPELMDMYLDVNDTIALADMKATVEKNGGKWFVPAIRGGKPENIIIPLSVDQVEQMEEINERAAILENPDTFVDPKDDNKLKLLSDSTKCALDPRIEEPDLDEPEVGKLKTTYDILISEDKMAVEKYGRSGVQLVFCDLGVPKSAQGLEREKLRVVLDNLESENEGMRIKAEAEFDKYSPSEVESIMSDGAFCFQDALRSKLTASGEYFKEHEVASLHDAKNDKDRLELYRRCNAGEIKALLCTTSKGGEGMNVNRFALGVIDVDAPWRPSDMIQRIGRVVRQNNWFFENFPNYEVYVKNLATERSTDAWKYQTLEQKESALSKIVNGRVSERSIEDVGVSTESLSEMKAMSSGNDLIFRQHQIKQEIKSLETDLSIQHSQVSRYRREKQLMEFDLKKFPARIKWAVDIGSSMSSYPSGSLEVLAENSNGKMVKAMRSLLNVEMKSGKTFETAMDGGKAVLYDMMRFNKRGNYEDEFIAKVNGIDIFISKDKLSFGDNSVQCEFSKDGDSRFLSFNILDEKLNSFGGKIKRFLEREANSLASINIEHENAKSKYQDFMSLPQPIVDEGIKEKLQEAEKAELAVIESINSQEKEPVIRAEVEERMIAFERKYKNISSQDSDFQEEFEDTMNAYKSRLETIDNGDDISKDEFSKFSVLVSMTAKSLKKELGLSRTVVGKSPIPDEESISNEVIITDPNVIADAIKVYDEKFKWMSTDDNFKLVYESAKNRLSEASEILTSGGGYTQEKIDNMISGITIDAVTIQDRHQLVKPITNDDVTKSILQEALVEDDPEPQLF
ncbi:MAG: helicase-related protein [Colwellia sp.]